jgi:2-keto-4-pentenoate hydratase/2-oxohepta-3-ene-1,7-dioic acid hydratase in catechol pathway
MKLVSYRFDKKNRYGVLRENAIFDASARLKDASTLCELLEQDRLSELGEVAARESADHAVEHVEFLLPVPHPRKILCAGRNYRAYHEVVHEGRTPDYPSIFARFADSFSAHRQPILKPKAGEALDYEGELVVVIGKAGRHVARERAFEHVAGYTIMNEGTVRDWMKRGTQNTPAKNFYHSGGLGPWIVTTDEVADPSRLRIITRRNGDVVQDGGTDRMIFDIPYLIAHISQFTVLQTGDLIATGSPGGSAIESDSPQWLRAGETLEVEIPEIGVLTNPIEAE